MKEYPISLILVILELTVFSIPRASFAAEPVYEYVDDATITTKAYAILAEDPDSHAFKIDVDTTAGNVVLTGSVNSLVTKNRIISRIKLIKGVKSVRSLLNVND